MNKELASAPFNQSLIKKRRGNFGSDIVYVPVCEYIRRLNEVFDYNWSFKIENAWESLGNIIVLGAITSNGITKQAYGGTLIKYKRGTSEPVDLADDYKAAATDALKKAASLLGIGLHLWDDDDRVQVPYAEVPNIKQAKPEEKKTNIDEISHSDRVSRTIDAFAKWGIARGDLEKCVDKPDGMWDEGDFLYLRNEWTRLSKSKSVTPDMLKARVQ